MSRNKKWKNNSKELVDGEWRNTKCHVTWNNMMNRCYNDKYHQKQPTYIGCAVCDEWLDFDVFYDWFQLNYKDGHQLDKDLLEQGNKIYSPTTCVFIPQSINLLLVERTASRGKYPIGVYYHKLSKKYLARCNNGKGKLVYLGLFLTPQEAHNVYKQYKYQLIRDIATESLKSGSINEQTYSALLNWKVESDR